MASSIGAGDGRMRTNASSHVLIIPYPAQPHILPMLDLANKICACGDITVTFVSFRVLIDRLDRESLNDAIHLIGVPDDLPGFNPPSHLPKNPVFFRESLQLKHNLQPFLESLQQGCQDSGCSRPSCVVLDVLLWWAPDVGLQLKVPRFVSSANPACFVASLLFESEYSDVVHMHGLPSPAVRVVPSWAHFIVPTLTSNTMNEERKSRPYLDSLCNSKGILLNTLMELEPEAVDAISTRLSNVPVLPVGPLGQSFAKNVSMEGLQASDEAMVLDWLDRRARSSVLYVCFGTTGMIRLGERHVRELAKGLQASEQPFVWVLRAPHEYGNDVRELLPAGFEERVKGRGLLLTGWAPQIRILEHPSTGGFLSSCGWNSSIESVIRAVPVIGWPSFADQPIICRYLVAKKFALAPRQQKQFFIEAEQIVEAIRMVFQSEEGRLMRERMEKFKIVAEDAMFGPQGSTPQNVDKFVKILKRLPADLHNRNGIPSC